jgi:hypothetical protein
VGGRFVVEEKRAPGVDPARFGQLVEDGKDLLGRHAPVGAAAVGRAVLPTEVSGWQRFVHGATWTSIENAVIPGIVVQAAPVG